MMNSIAKQKSCDDFDKRIELCVNELSNLLQNKVKPNIKDEFNTTVSDERFDGNILQSTLETIADILRREDCDNQFETLYPIILKLKQNIYFTFSLDSNESKSGVSLESSSSVLTFYNVNINSIWETICYQIEKLILNDMIKNSLDHELECEKICLQLRFLSELKSSDGLIIWRLFNTMRVCKLEAEIIDWSSREFDKSLHRILTLIDFDCKLYKSGYFGSYNMSYSELITPYIQSVGTKFETEVSLLNGNVSNLINLIKTMNEFENSVQEVRQDFPRFMESPEQDGMFDWKTIIENNGCIHLFHRSIYNKINANLRELNCFNNNSYNECEINGENILCCVSKTFADFEDYEHLIALNSFMTFLSYAIPANIVDFFVHHFNNGKYDTILQKYTLLNTVNFIREKLEKIHINVDKFIEISNKIIKLIIAKHISILFMNRNTQYWLLYLKKLWLELILKLKFFKNRESIFIFVFSETVHNFSRIGIPKADAFFILNNIDELLFKYVNSKAELLDNDKYNIHSSCWLILIKLILQISTKENFISNLKQNNYLAENPNNYANTHWIHYIKPNLMQTSFWFNAKLCIEKGNNKNKNTIIRTFLSNNCGFSSFILCTIDDNPNSMSIRTAVDIFKVIILQKFRPQSLSSVVLSLIVRNNSWHEFDKSTLFNPESHNWWYNALESLITPDIDNHLIQNLKSLINESRIASLVTNEILEICKLNDIIFRDIVSLVDESFQILITVINNVIQSLPTTLITSLQVLNQSMPESVDPLSQSLTLNVLVSSVVKQLQSCAFLPQTDDLSVNFCKKVSISFIEKLLDENNNTNKYFTNAKKLLEKKNFGNNNSIINEEIEFEMISSSISDDSNYSEIFERLSSLIIEYRKVINENINNCQIKGTENALIIELSKSEKTSIEFSLENTEKYDYNRIIDLVDWGQLEFEIKSRLDQRTRLALIYS